MQGMLLSSIGHLTAQLCQGLVQHSKPTSLPPASSAFSSSAVKRPMLMDLTLKPQAMLQGRVSHTRGLAKWAAALEALGMQHAQVGTSDLPDMAEALGSIAADPHLLPEHSVQTNTPAGHATNVDPRDSQTKQRLFPGSCCSDRSSRSWRCCSFMLPMQEQSWSTQRPRRPDAHCKVMLTVI